VKPTVATAVSARPVDDKGVVDWANREVVPVLSQVRDAVNVVGTQRVTGRTAGAGAYLKIWQSSDLPTDAAWNVSAYVTAMAAAPGGPERAAYFLGGLVSSVAGAVALVGTTTVYAQETTAAIDARFGVLARGAYLEVRDAGAGMMDFVAVVDVAEVRTT
jgi:hypothetical protein